MSHFSIYRRRLRKAQSGGFIHAYGDPGVAPLLCLKWKVIDINIRPFNVQDCFATIVSSDRSGAALGDAVFPTSQTMDTLLGARIALYMEELTVTVRTAQPLLHIDKLHVGMTEKRSSGLGHSLDSRVVLGEELAPPCLSGSASVVLHPRFPPVTVDVSPLSTKIYTIMDIHSEGSKLGLSAALVPVMSTGKYENLVLSCF